MAQATEASSTTATVGTTQAATKGKTDSSGAGGSGSATSASVSGGANRNANVSAAAAQNKFASSSLYVGDLSKDVTEATLFELFNAVGPVASIRVCRDGATRQSLGYAYVNFHSTKDAERALDTMNFANIKGKQCRIMWSQRDPSLRRSNRGNVFVKCLHESIDNKTLYDTFSVFGNILSCKVATNDDGSSRQYGYVHYADEASATKAIEGVNGMSINNKVVEACKFQPRSERKNNVAFTNVYVKYIPRHCDEAMCKDAFAKLVSDKLGVAAEITHSKFWIQDFGVSGCFNFKTHEQAKAAVDTLNGFDLRSIYPDPNGDNNDDEKSDEKDENNKDNNNNNEDSVDKDASKDDNTNKESTDKTDDNANKDDTTTTTTTTTDKNNDENEEKGAIVGVVAGNKNAPNKAEHRLLFATRAEKRKTRDFLLAKEKGIARGGFGRGAARGGRGQPRYYLGGNLYVKHLKPEVDDEKLKEMFAKFGEIQSAKVMKDDNNQSRQFGFVAFKTKDAATRALHEMNMKQQGGHSKPLYVSRAQSRQARINRKLQYMNRRGRGGGGQGNYNMYQGPFSQRPGNNNNNMGGGAGGYNQYASRNNFTPSGGIYGPAANPLQAMGNMQGGQGPVGGVAPGIGGIGPVGGVAPNLGLNPQQQLIGAALGRPMGNIGVPMQQFGRGGGMLPQYNAAMQPNINPMLNQMNMQRLANVNANPALNTTLQQLLPGNPFNTANIGGAVGGQSNANRGVGMSGPQGNFQSGAQMSGFNAQQGMQGTSQTNQVIRGTGSAAQIGNPLQNVIATQSGATAGITNPALSAQMTGQQQSVRTYSVQSGGVVGGNQASATNTQSVPQGGASASVISAGGRDSAAMKESHPLTQQMLARIATPAEKKRLIGERLFPKIQVVEPRLAGKITGMLLEMDNKVLLELLNNNTALHAKINEALAVLQEHHKSQQNASNANRTSASNQQ